MNTYTLGFPVAMFNCQRVLLVGGFGFLQNDQLVQLHVTPKFAEPVGMKQKGASIGRPLEPQRLHRDSQSPTPSELKVKQLEAAWRQTAPVAKP